MVTGTIIGFAYEPKEREAHPNIVYGHRGWKKGARRARVLLKVEEESGRQLEVDVYNYVRSRCQNTAINAKVARQILEPMIGSAVKVEIEYDGRIGGVTLIKPRPA